VSLVTGIIEHPPEASIIGAKYYGYPLVWRVIMVAMPSHTDFLLTNLVIDVLFWVIGSLLTLIILMRMSKRFVKEPSANSPLSDRT
jgi:membrane protein implicated in regulation of membrane protease activity